MSKISERLAELAKRVATNEPDHRDPEKFHAEKSEIAHQLRKIAEEART